MIWVVKEGPFDIYFSSYASFSHLDKPVHFTLPKLNGLDAIIEIKKFAPDIRFMMLSSTSRPDELITAKKLNVLTYLVKPVNLDTLFKEIANTLMNKANGQKGAQ